ncbi:response regulator [Pseudonocardia endophytica]|uniref:response regulator n=1 Tax=Pseudonocardia endophytica TaxID=401976 RepID=UPI001051C62B|nr:response regulator transcription factor [Pseudonocardia endophytica]
MAAHTGPVCSAGRDIEESRGGSASDQGARDGIWATDDEPAASTRLLVFSRSTLVRCGLRFLLRTQDAIDVIAEAATTSELVRLCADLRPAIVLIDLTGEGERPLGPQMLAGLRRRQPRMRAIVIVGPQTREETNALVATGVAGVVGIDASPSAMVAAVTEVGADRGYFDRTSGRTFDGDPTQDDYDGSAPPLSPRECQVTRIRVRWQ